jgi:hypothetical protein
MESVGSEIYRCEEAVFALMAAPQSRSSNDWLVGRRSAVSSSSALRASSCGANPRARATRSATSQVGLAMPRSSPRMQAAAVRQVAISTNVGWSWCSVQAGDAPGPDERACGARLGRSLYERSVRLSSKVHQHGEVWLLCCWRLPRWGGAKCIRHPPPPPPATGAGSSPAQVGARRTSAHQNSEMLAAGLSPARSVGERCGDIR